MALWYFGRKAIKPQCHNAYKNILMITIIAILNTVIFIFLALLHFYWVLGGQWALAGAIPGGFKDIFNGERKGLMRFATIIVALGLLGFTLTSFLNYQTLGLDIPYYLIRRTTIVIGLIFIARAIGDLNYCGFFRKIKEGIFAERDRMIYTTFCLYLGLSTLLLAFNN